MKNFYPTLALAFVQFFSILSYAQGPEIRIPEQRPEPGDRMVPYNETWFASATLQRSTDPLIAAMVNAVSADSLRATLTEMQSWGSRFLMNDNNKEIATSLMNRFLAYGYTDVVLDSFYLAIPNWNGLHDSAWQYNVVCTVTGSSAPGEIYITGGHWDSYSTVDPFHDAPGTNDNATAVAATLEIARVMKLYDYRPEATIRFVLFAAEELGLFGSRYAAVADRYHGNDVRYMLNMDMISNNPENTSLVKVYQYQGWEWAGLVAGEATERYTNLDVIFPANNVNTGSDSFPYWLEGFPSAYFEEYNFSPHWHLPSDTLGNCNIPYLRQVTGGALATLAEQQRLPHPRDLRAHSAPAAITLNWMPTSNGFVSGYNIYRADSSGGSFQRVNILPVAGSSYSDIPPELNRQYFYAITTVNDSLEESGFSNEVVGARFHFCDTLLVIANTKGTKITPDSIRGFYHSILDTIAYRWVDANALYQPDLSLISRYRNIFWMSNTLEAESMNTNLYQSMIAFSENGGNLLFAGFNPGKYWISNVIPYPLEVPDEVYFHSCFRIDSIDRKVQSMLCGAYPAQEGYSQLRIDSAKCMDKNFPGQIYNIEVYHAESPGQVIYRFDSRQDTTTSYGKMKHRPVGTEYLGTDHRSILLSFPLWYLDTADARNFLGYVLSQKFSDPAGLAEDPPQKGFGLDVSPNPVYGDYVVTVSSGRAGILKLVLVSPEGRVRPLKVCHISEGIHRFGFSGQHLTPGIYQVVARFDGMINSRMIIRIR